MFGKLKEKLKGALSIFSKKAEESAEIKKVELPPVEEKEDLFVEKKKESTVHKAVEKAAETKETPIEKTEIKKGIKLEKEKTSQIEVQPKIKEKISPVLIKDEVKPILDKEKLNIVNENGEVIGEEITAKTKELPTREQPKKSLPIEIVPDSLIETKKNEPEQKKSFFGKIKEAITTKIISGDKFEELFWELEVALLENNVSVEVIEKIKDDLRTELVDKPLPRDVEKKILETLKDTLTKILTFEPVDLLQSINRRKDNNPYVVAFFGINGAGKTTSIAKLTHYLQKNNHSVVLAACDTFRAAAIQQLEEHAKKLGVKIIKHDYGSDAAAVAYDAIKFAEKNNIDVVLIDTAGRLHSNINLMAELEKIIRVTKPNLKLFVGESITGNDCIEQARKFQEVVDLDGIILTKADVDEKGGAPLSISYTIKKPILFLGMGQGYEHLEEFDKEKILTRLGL
ncbi:signal recognition particle-docking protein FtsY [Candidatus Woesearchaeota archaeon]|nr:signal recognition particle-docking protein FtsY [Candidatus Woesearchaeota archaeon]